MRAVVTGAAGFIGSLLCEKLLAEGWEVVGVDRFSDYYDPRIKRKNLQHCLKNPRFTLVEEDLNSSNFDFLRKGDFVFHLSAQPGVRKSWGKEFEIYVKDNVLSTQRLLEKCREIEISKFIYASSSSIYGAVEELPLKEDSNPKPFSPYGVTKLAGENLVMLYHRNFQLPGVALRFFTVIGRRQRPDMAFHKFLKALWLDEEIKIFGDGRQSRDFTHVDNILEGILLAAEKAKPGSIYNLGSGKNLTLLEVIEIMEKITGKKAKIEFTAKAKGDVYHTLADISRIRRELGYEPKKTLEEGIEEEWQWIKALYS